MAQLIKQEVYYLGHILSPGKRCLPKKFKAIGNLPLLTTPKPLRIFLGLMRYHRQWITGYIQLARPFLKILKGKHRALFCWAPKQEEAFKRQKKKKKCVASGTYSGASQDRSIQLFVTE